MPDSRMTHVDLFSGIGGFSLAAGWAGFETVLFVENNDYCQRVLKKHWPNVPIIGDIRDVNKETVANAYRERCEVGGTDRTDAEVSRGRRAHEGGSGGDDRRKSGTSQNEETVADAQHARRYGCEDGQGVIERGDGSSTRQEPAEQPSGLCIEQREVGSTTTATRKFPTIDLLAGGDASGRKVCEGSKGLRDGIVDTGLGRPLQSHTPDDVEDIETARMRVSEQLEIWGSKPFLQGDTCVGQGSEQVGTSDRGRGSCPTNSVPGVQENREVQERTTDDTGSPHRLREAVGSDVAMSEMPPRMAQEISGKGGDKTGIRSDSNNVATWGGIDLLTGGFP